MPEWTEKLILDSERTNYNQRCLVDEFEKKTVLPMYKKKTPKFKHIIWSNTRGHIEYKMLISMNLRPQLCLIEGLSIFLMTSPSVYVPIKVENAYFKGKSRVTVTSLFPSPVFSYAFPLSPRGHDSGIIPKRAL